MKEPTEQQAWQINQFLIMVAASLIILGLLKLASDILVPFLIAVAIAIILSPLFTYLESRRIPKVVSMVVAIFLTLLPIILLGGYVAEEAREFAGNYEAIKVDFLQGIDRFIGSMQHYGIDIDKEKINAILQQSNLAAILKKLITQANNQFSNLFLIFFMVAFMLMESESFYGKMIQITKEYKADSRILIELLEKIKSYFIIKVKTSLVTSLWVLVVLWFYDIHYFFLWAVLAFFLNFIPVIGSILAAIPAVALALLDFGLAKALWIAGWYLVINMVIGNILEPRIMGKGLGLSALVIFLSMTFWGWLFGPTGMILSVPLTMLLQYLFGRYRETQWIALLLSDYKPTIH
jgi:predicted PurR-regulated permease PerM